MFSRRHYENIADTLKAERPAANWDANKRLMWNSIVKGMVGSFKRDNSGFKPERFLARCGDLFHDLEGSVAIEFSACAGILVTLAMLAADLTVYCNLRESTASLAHTACMSGGRYLIPDASLGYVTSQNRTLASAAAFEAFDAAKGSAYLIPATSAALTVVVAADGMKIACSVEASTTPLFGVQINSMHFHAYAGG